LSGAESVLDAPKGAPRARLCLLCLQLVARGLELFTSTGDKNTACILALRAEVEPELWGSPRDPLQATPGPSG